jgi:hypothetical protein
MVACAAVWVLAANRSSAAHTETNERHEEIAKEHSCVEVGTGTYKTTGMARRPALRLRRVARRRGVGHDIQMSTQGSTASTARRPGATARGGWRGSTSVQGSGGKTTVKKVRRSRGSRQGWLGLMQGKKSSTASPSAGPAPAPQRRLGHGRLRLQGVDGLQLRRSTAQTGLASRYCSPAQLPPGWLPPSSPCLLLPPPYSSQRLRRIGEGTPRGGGGQEAAREGFYRETP